MDPDTILRIRPALKRFLHEFDDCFGRADTRVHLGTYVEGQLSDLRRKSVEPIADAAGTPPRTLQEFLGLSRWDEARLRDRLGQRVARRHADPGSVGIIDETSFPKKGAKTACVQRQWCGARGKTDNCVVSVHLGYATAEFHTLLDGELYLPEKTWDQDRARCRQAGIPDDVVYRSKWRIALAQYRRAVANGVRFAWLTFDEGYGGKPPFLRALDALGQNYVGEVPANFMVWTKRPQVLHRVHGRDRGRGRPRKVPRLKVKSNPPLTVANVLRYSPILRRVPWETYHVKDGSQGPMVWEAKRIPVWLKDPQGLPTPPHHLVVARNVLNRQQVKFFLSNAPEATPVEPLLVVAFSRWRIERMFQDTKGELGMDHFEVRTYRSIQRHLILSCLSHLFLAEFRERCRGEKSGSNDSPSRHRHGPAGAGVVSRRAVLTQAGRMPQRAIGRNRAPQRQGRPQPPQTYPPAITRVRHPAHPSSQMPLAENLAL